MLVDPGELLGNIEEGAISLVEVIIIYMMIVKLKIIVQK